MINNNYLCFTSLPAINELLCIFATIHSPEALKTSLYNLVILKCRQLIFENDNIIAFPNLDGMYGIYIIVKESFYEKGKLAEYLKKFTLKGTPPSVAPKHIYEDCCLYTLMAKLAPKWNVVSNYLVRGRDFLTNPEPRDCVHMSVRINEKGDTTLSFKVSQIKLPTVSIDKLDLPESCSLELRNNERVSFKYSNAKSIRVLPSLKRGNILSISMSLNESSTMKNYQQIRRHWKNTYGYRLPEDERGQFYVEVSFFEGSPVFTYPGLCVRPHEPTAARRVAPGPAVAALLADLQRAAPRLLGTAYPTPCYATQTHPRLDTALHTQNILHPNTCDKPTPESNLNNKPSFTQNPAFIVLATQTPSQGRASGTQNQQDGRSNLSQLLSQLNKTEYKTPIYLTQKSTCSQPISQTQTTTHSTQNTHLDNENITGNALNNSVTPKNKNKSLLSLKNVDEISSTSDNQQNNVSKNMHCETDDETPKYEPSFCKSVKQCIKTEQGQIKTPKTSLIAEELKNQMRYLSGNSTQGSDKSQQNTSEAKIVPKFAPKFSKSKTQKAVCNQKNNNIKKTAENDKMPATKINNIENLSLDDKFVSNNDRVKSTTKSLKRSEIMTHPKFNMDATKTITKDISQLENSNPMVPKLQGKRLNMENTIESPATKKIKTKSEPKEISNMEEHIKNNSINKLTVPTLVNWLKARSVKCTTKDKKVDLIQKVRDNLSI